jgi:type I restriction enzyme M protein
VDRGRRAALACAAHGEESGWTLKIGRIESLRRIDCVLAPTHEPVREAFAAEERSKIFATTDFGYRKITVEQPLRLAFRIDEEGLTELEQEKAFVRLATSRKKGEAGEKESELGRLLQESILQVLSDLGEAEPETVWRDRAVFRELLETAFREAQMKVLAPVTKAIESTFGERDEEAEICLDKKGQPEPDPQLRDTENVPLWENVDVYFKREVKPHVPDAWINREVVDQRDGGVGKVGYEINFNRYFYKYVPPRPLEVIEAEIKEFEGEIVGLLRDVTG